MLHLESFGWSLLSDYYNSKMLIYTVIRYSYSMWCGWYIFECVAAYNNLVLVWKLFFTCTDQESRSGAHFSEKVNTGYCGCEQSGRVLASILACIALPCNKPARQSKNAHIKHRNSERQATKIGDSTENFYSRWIQSMRSRELYNRTILLLTSYSNKLEVSWTHFSDHRIETQCRTYYTVKFVGKFVEIMWLIHINE